jgi:hypothetical protein
MTPRQIGRITVFKICSLSVLVIFLLPIVIGLIASIGDSAISISYFYKNLFGDAFNNIPFLIIQLTVVLIGIWFFGSIAGEFIIIRNKNKFKIGFFTILSLWGLLFLSSTLTAGIQNSIDYGTSGFFSAVTSWLIYGFFLYLFLGCVHALTIGYLIGKKIFTIGQTNDNESVRVN